MNLTGKTILITGGGSGIGLEAAKQFLNLGARVIITGRNQKKLDAAKKLYPKLTAVQSDAGNNDDTVLLFERVKALGGIDILYHNAGVGVPPSNLGITSENHVKGAAYEMEINYLGVIRLNNLFMDMLNSRKEAAIIHTTSILSYVPSILEATYSASKTALAFYTKTLRVHLEIIGSHIKVFELLPPVVDTEMTAERTDKKLSPEALVKGLIAGLKDEEHTIRVGDTKLLYLLNRLIPKFAFRLVNSRRDRDYLRNGR